METMDQPLSWLMLFGFESIGYLRWTKTEINHIGSRMMQFCLQVQPPGSTTVPWFSPPPSPPTAPRFPGARYLAIGRDEVFTNWDVPHRAISLRGWHTYSQQTLARRFLWSGVKTSGRVTPMNWQITATCSGRNFTWHNWDYIIPNYKPLNPFLTLGRCSKKQKAYFMVNNLQKLPVMGKHTQLTHKEVVDA